jgi:hypothetical protein
MFPWRCRKVRPRPLRTWQSRLGDKSFPLNNPQINWHQRASDRPIFSINVSKAPIDSKRRPPRQGKNHHIAIRIICKFLIEKIERIKRLRQFWRWDRDRPEIRICTLCDISDRNRNTSRNRFLPWPLHITSIWAFMRWTGKAINC